MHKILLILLLASCKGKTEEIDEPDDNVESWDPRFDAFVEQLQIDLAASDAPGVSVAILQGGEVVFARGFGSGHPDTGQPVADTTLFQIGSTTKMFTAVALLQQVEAGKFSLETSLGEALPDLEFAYNSSWDDEVKLKHLLTHQGGFYDYIDWSGSADDDELESWMLGDYAEQAWLMNPPGAFWNYSNPNFSFAGLVVERAVGQSYPDQMREAIFAPLNMNRTFQRKAEVEADGDYALGVGYTSSLDDYGSVLMEDVADPAAARPAGSGTWTTPTQMLEMARFLMEGNSSVLSDIYREALTTSQVSLLTPDDGAYGYGMFIYPGLMLEQEYYAIPVWDHGGNTLSYSSAFVILPEQDFAISILSSGYGTDFSTSIGTAMATLIDNLPAPTSPPEYPFDPTALDEHVGTYNDSYNVGEIVITREGDSLLISMPLLDELGYEVQPELEPISSDMFYLNLDGQWYDLTFIDGEGGAPSQYIRNRAFVGTRDDEAEMNGLLSPLSMAPTTLQQPLSEARLPFVPLHLRNDHD